MRFNLNTTLHTEAVQYLRNRALQIAHTGAVLKKLIQFTEGVWAEFEFESNTYHALYILEQFRGNGLFYNLWKRKSTEIGYDIKMITTTQCQLASYFRHVKIPFVLCNGLTNTEEYKSIESIYADNSAKRSGVHLMNHIDEGLYILHKLNSTNEAKLAYILHPIFQPDLELNFYINHPDLKKFDPKALILVIEYRSVANEYLSHREIKSLDEIRLSPLDDVNTMLKADKIQNRKDFELYHLGTHPRSAELNQYFLNWCDKLLLDSEFYASCKEELQSITNMTVIYNDYVL